MKNEKEKNKQIEQVFTREGRRLEEKESEENVKVELVVK